MKVHIAIMAQDTGTHVEQLVSIDLWPSSVRARINMHLILFSLTIRITKFKYHGSDGLLDNTNAILEENSIASKNPLINALIAFLLLLLSGDIEENPGPLSKLIHCSILL